MIWFKQDLQDSEVETKTQFHFNHPLNLVCEKINKWESRFPYHADDSIYNDLHLLSVLATKKYLNHHNRNHLFRLLLSIHFMKRELTRCAAFFPNQRCLEMRWIPASLNFSFTSKNVLGCLVGSNMLDRYELFDKQNVFLALQKLLPDIKLVEDSSYRHPLQQEQIKLFYFEIEKVDQSPFSLKEQTLLKSLSENKIRNSFEKLSPTVYMGQNDEEIYKNILVLSKEINSLEDLPQAYITLEQQTGKEIIFCVTLVYRSPSHHFSLKNYFPDCLFISMRHSVVKYVENQPIEAHVFRLHLPREPSLLRSDNSLDFYFTRKKITLLINSAIGEFRDFNGGLIMKQHELLYSFKELFCDFASHDSELMEAFFYALTPVENKAVLPINTLSQLFTYFLENWKHEIPIDSSYILKTQEIERQVFIFVRGNNSNLRKTISTLLEEHLFKTHDIAYNFIEMKKEFFFNAVLNMEAKNALRFIHSLEKSLNYQHQKTKTQQTLRIALEFSFDFLDPRVGGDVNRSEIMKLLFEGLTRFNQDDIIENALAESIQVSSNAMEYVFKLRPSLWNDGTAVTAYDFEYAWKRILSPDFETAFASFFYPIKNAKEAKEGKVSIDQVGIHVLDDLTLKVDLAYPARYFLQLTANPLYSPVRRSIDLYQPNWHYKTGKNYPCNGPFQLKINQPNHGYVLVRNPLYLDAPHITLDQITLALMSSAQAMQAFQKKEVDWVANPYGIWDPNYTTEEGVHLISASDKWVCWLVFNTLHPNFQSVKLRQAFSYAIQRAEIVSGNFLPAYSPLPHSDENYPKLFPEFDKERALKLLHEGLEELNLTVQDLSPLELTFHDKGIQKHAALCLQKQFEESLGITCILSPFSWATFFQKMTQSHFQIGLMHWSSCLNDPIYTLNAFKFVAQDVNFAKWENSNFQNLLNLSEQNSNPLQCFTYLQQAEEILCHEMPIIPLFYQPQQALTRKDLFINDRSPCRAYNIARSFYQRDKL